MKINDEEQFVGRIEIARRYKISVRLVDYLRKRGVLPYYRISKRAIRFSPGETDVAIARYRRKGIGE